MATVQWVRFSGSVAHTLMRRYGSQGPQSSEMKVVHIKFTVSCTID